MLACVLAGAESFVDIARFGEKKIEFLRRFRPFHHGTPAHDHLGDIFAVLDAERFQRCFVDWVAALTGAPKEVVAIDGKTLRRSGEKKSAKAAIHMVSAFAARQRLVLGQVKVADKANEIVAIPKLLDLLAIEGAIVTLDAIGCQRAIAQQILDKKADYVLALKGNQGTLREDVELFAAEQKANGFKDAKISRHQTVDGDHGRIETRTYTANQVVLDDAIRDQLVAMTTDFKALWRDPSLPNRERKRLLAYVVEDVTLVKVPAEGITRIHVRFKGGQTETLTTQNPKSSAQQVKTRPEVVELVNTLLDDHTYPEIADILNDRGIRPGGSARRGQDDARFTALRVAYLAHEYELRSRYDCLRARGILTRQETAASLGICESTLMRWVEHGLVVRHAYNAHAYLYEAPGPNPPIKHCSRWDQLVDRAARAHMAVESKSLHRIEGDAV